MRLDGEHDEGIWIPGARFEAAIAADRRFASITDSNKGHVFESMDAGVLKHLVEITGHVKTLMEGGDPEEFDPMDFRASVAKNRSRADIAYVSGVKFALLTLDDVKELHELSSVVLENLEAQAV